MSGIVALNGMQDVTVAEQMLEKLAHRGGRGIETIVTEDGVLGCNASDDQSFFADPDSGRAICLDGVISYVAGKPVEEVGDFEGARTLLTALDEQGPEALSGIDGAFALLAQTRHGLMAVRDRFGQKPLYYARAGDRIYFASELKAIPGGGGDFDEIAIIPPGISYLSSTGFTTYPPADTELEGESPVPASVEAATEELLDLLAAAVKRVGLRQGNVGIFLSGGVDSSIIASLARRLEGPLKTFTAGSEGSLDMENARLVAEYLGADHTEHQYTREDMLTVLPDVIYHLESFDWSLVRSAIANYIVARLAREHGMDFILVGEGADELFGGYHYLKDKATAQQVKELEALLSAGHNAGFQRVDRMNAAHSMGVAMPFMDRRVVRYADRIPIEWKIYRPEQVEKWILRHVAARLIPDEVAWRRKDQFSKGAGSAQHLVALAEEKISDEAFAREREPFPGKFLRSKEELYYYRIYRDFFPEQAAFETVGRWEHT